MVFYSCRKSISRPEGESFLRMNILAVGIATLDIINRVERYPVEDSEVRAVSQRRSRGGNATNTLTILSQLGHECAWGGVLPQDADAAFIEELLLSQKIDLRHVRHLPSGRLPTSYITLSEANGSRTIVHLRDLPEYSAAWFLGDVNPDEYQWMHFEGRAPGELGVMLERVCRIDGLHVSLEIEKPRAGIEQLFHLPEVLLFSRHYAQATGCGDAKSLLERVAARLGRQRPLLFCTWGDQGAWSLDRHGELLHVPAVRLTSVVDTIAAGDVFNAAVIHALLHDATPMEALVKGCELAALKCSMDGVEDIFS